MSHNFHTGHNPDDAHLNLWKPKMFPHYTDTQITLAHCCGPTETNQKTAAVTKMGPFLCCSLSPPPPPCTRTLTHTHAYHDKWPVTCLCEHGTKGSTPSPQGWQSGSLGQQRGLPSGSTRWMWLSVNHFTFLAGVRGNLQRKHNSTGWGGSGAE